MDGLVQVAVLGSDDGKVGVRDRAAHGRVGGAVWLGVVGNDLAGVFLGRPAFTPTSCYRCSQAPAQRNSGLWDGIT